jgi:hypothetical protein
VEVYLRSPVCPMTRTEIISPFNSYLFSSNTAVRLHRGSYNENSAGIYAVGIIYSSDGAEVSVQDVTSTLSSCDTHLLQFNALTYVICHSILSPVLTVRASTVHISLICHNSVTTQNV